MYGGSTTYISSLATLVVLFAQSYRIEQGTAAGANEYVYFCHHIIFSSISVWLVSVKSRGASLKLCQLLHKHLGCISALNICPE